MKTLFHCSSLLIALALCLYNASAQVPRLLSYQGILTDTTGVTKPDGNYDLTFRLYDAESSGSAIWIETKTLPIRHGLFSTQLGDVVPFGASVKFDKPYWLSLQLGGYPELAPRIPLSATAYSLNAPQADSARVAGSVPNNSITSAKIVNGTIQLADIAQNGATDGQVLKWSSGAWTVAADEVGTGGTAGGWTDGGTTVRLSSISDTVALNTSSRLGKLNLSGDIGLNGESSLFFGTTSTYLGGTTGENLMLRASNDLKLYTGGTLTALAADNINLGHLGEASWLKMDNSTKRLGVGMGATDAIDDRLHVKNDLASSCWLRIESAHPTTWGQAGLRIQTPQNTWHLRMDTYTNANFPDGALSLYNSGGGAFETMTWLKDGRVGIGTKNPIRKLHVNGSVEVEDTLYAGTVNAAKLVGQPGVVHKKANNQTIEVAYTLIDSLTVKAPSAGFVVLLFSGSVYSDHTFGDRTTLRAAITTGRDGSGRLGGIEWQVDIKIPSAYCHIPIAFHAVAQVSGGGDYEYFVGGHNFGDVYGRDYLLQYDGRFSAIFIPASYGTVETAPRQTDTVGDVARHTDALSSPSESLESRVNALTSELEAVKKELASRER